MYLSGRARHNHHTYSPSFILPSGEYFEMVPGLMDRTQITLFVHHLQSQCGARAPLLIKFFNSLLQLSAVPGSYDCSYMRDRLIGPDAQISQWSLDFLTVDQMASNGLFQGTKDDRSSRAEFFPPLGVV